MGPVFGRVNCDRDLVSVLGVRNVVMVLLGMRREVRGGPCKFLRLFGCEKQRDVPEYLLRLWIVNSHGKMRPNENKMSDGGRERALIGVEVWKSS
jgi:hypothetical protein